MNNEEKSVYISAPITGVDKTESDKAFFQGIELACDLGFCRIIDPRQNGLPKDAPWNKHMAADITRLVTCDAIILCEGWATSRGCRLEHHIAIELGIQIIFLKQGRSYF